MANDVKKDPPLKEHRDAIASATYVAYCNAMGGGKPHWDTLSNKEKRAWMVAGRNAILQAKIFGAPEAEGVIVPPDDAPAPDSSGRFMKKEG